MACARRALLFALLLAALIAVAPIVSGTAVAADAAGDGVETGVETGIENGAAKGAATASEEAAGDDTGKRGFGSETGRFYVGLEGGLGVFNQFDPGLTGIGKTDFKPGGAAVLRAGWQWRDHIRLDGLVTWVGAQVPEVNGRIDITAATGNIYYDFSAPGNWIRAYLGVGVGVAGGWLESGVPPATAALREQSGVGFAYLISGGSRFRLSEDWSGVLAWQFLGTAGLIPGGTGSSIDPTMHAFMVGLQRSF